MSDRSSTEFYKLFPVFLEFLQEVFSPYAAVERGAVLELEYGDIVPVELIQFLVRIDVDLVHRDIVSFREAVEHLFGRVAKPAAFLVVEGEPHHG